MASRVEDKYCVLCKLVRERGGGDFEKIKNCTTYNTSV
tara:strand:+ start:1064 stop:1177 length:114 start_codon:yes stop_codon:yes gene_type:complete